MLPRILTLVRKELQALLRDRQGRLLLVMPVIMQLLIFSNAATLEVKNNTLAILNQDSGAASAELIQRWSKAAAFTRVLHVKNEQDLKELIDSQKALLAVRLASDFSRAIAAGTEAPIQVVLDGRRSNSAQIALGYLAQILDQWNLERQGARPPAVTIVTRHWYNPNLDYVRHILPSLVAIITTISTLVVTALSVAREREQGTFDQLLVSPLTPGVIMIGKTVPALLVAAFQGTLITLASVFVFGVPLRGSLLLFYGSIFFYILALSGFGLLISSISSTQQQAFLGAFAFLMPGVLLSGFPAPVENMPLWLQYVNWFNPLQHFIVIVKGVFLKDATAAMLWPSVFPLLIVAVVTLAAANWMFRRRLA